MSKLAGIRAYQQSGYYAGGLLDIVKKGAKAVKGLISKGGAAMKGLTAKGGGMEAIMQQLGLTPGGGGEAAGGAAAGGARRRSRGITARELRGYRKVSNLLHREGMVSRRARGRK